MLAQLNGQSQKVDIYPLVKYYLDELEAYKLFQTYVPKGKADIEPAEGLCLLITNILTGNRPLYKVEEWLGDYADGRSEDIEKATKYNDDRLGGSCLDGLYKAERDRLMIEFSAQAIKVHNLETKKIHNDTTTLTLFGNYDKPTNGSVKPKRGYNKDGHPSCKQIVFGLNVTEDGHVPLSYTAYDGNTSDSKTHQGNWEALRKQLGKESFIYVADSKACDTENIEYIAGKNGQFIVMMPSTRSEVKEFHKQLKQKKVVWHEGYIKEDSRKKGQFTTYSVHERKSKEGYRIVWVHSDNKAFIDASKRQKKINNAIKKLRELTPKLNRYKLKERSAIQNAAEKAVKGVSDYVTLKITEHTEIVKKQQGAGKAGPNTRYRKETKTSYQLTWQLEKQAVSEAACTDGVFPLMDNTDLEATEVLKTYKQQPSLEKRHSTLKSVQKASPIFLKKSERIEAMLFLHFIALMIISLVERNIRMAIVSEQALPILPQGMKTKTPTWENIKYYFRNIYQLVITQGEKVLKTILKGLTPLHLKLLDFIKVPRSVYDELQGTWWRFI